MSPYPAKLVAVLILFAVVAYLATNTLLPSGDEKKSLLHVFDCRGMLRKITALREGNFGCENMETIEHKLVPSRRLRFSFLLAPPPPPTRSKQSAMRSMAPPPQIA